MTSKNERKSIGWREWVRLPDLGVKNIKAKVDTGARTSALHAFDMEVFRRAGREFVRFKVHPLQRDASRTVETEAEIHDHRHIRDSGGTRTFRPVIRTTLEILGEQWPIELTLFGRKDMGFRMLLGREAVRRRFVVDPGRSYVGGKPKKISKKRKLLRKDAGARKKGTR